MPRSSNSLSRDDEQFMRRALRLARRSEGFVEPNPMVGCVIVRAGRIIGEGRHRKFGGHHAEIDAMRQAGASVRGATFYVTLEPCSYHGKTPPCADALIAAGAARVVAGTIDPNPRVGGSGLAKLRQAGIEVTCGCLESEARDLIAPFARMMTEKRPWVIAKWAQSVDGKIATRTGDSKWISDERCRAHAHEVRGRMDAILVGVGTVVSDDPLLTCRDARPRRVATRIVLDPHLRTPQGAQLVKTARQTPTIVVCDNDAPRAKINRLTDAGCEVLRLRTTKHGLDLKGLLRMLAERGLTNLLVEGGGQTLGRFFDHGLIDEAHVYIAPRLIGGKSAVSPIGGVGAKTVAHAPALHPVAPLRRMGSGWFLLARLHV